MEDIILIINSPIKALSIAIKSKHIYKRNIGDSIIETMDVMKEKVYTHVPIIDHENRIIGIFSENVLFNYLGVNKIALIEEETSFKELRDYLKIENHTGEEFAFIGKNAFLYEVEDLFKNAFGNTKRLTVVYITETGKQKESILGMITPWDLLGK